MKQSLFRELPQIITSIFAVVLGLQYFGFETDGTNVPAPFNVLATCAFVWTVFDIAVFAHNSKRRALHDIIAGTVTIRFQPESAKPQNLIEN